MARISRKEYAKLYGPTKGDGVRLGDTSLIATRVPVEPVSFEISVWRT